MANSGIIKLVTSDVKAIAVDGTERLLQVGDTVLLNEEIRTGDAGLVSIWFADGTKLELKQNTSTLLNEDTFKQGLSETLPNPVQINAEDEVAAIQQALADDQTFDPTTLEAPAAGGTPSGTAGPSGGGHSSVGVDYLNPEQTPESGFETIGINNNEVPILDFSGEELILEPRVAADRAGGGTESVNLLVDGSEVSETYENTSVTGNLLLNTTNIDGSSSVISFSFGGQAGSVGSSISLVDVGELLIEDTGSYTFTPAAGFSGIVPNISYTVVDDTDTTDTVISALDITVIPTPTVQVTDHNGLSVGDNEVLEGATTAVSGDFELGASEGVLSITVAGIEILEADLLASGTSPIDIATDKGGVLSIDGYNEASGTVNYSYIPDDVAKDHSAGDNSIVDQLEITVTDDNNITSSPDVLDILIKDTAPEAFDNDEHLSQEQTWLVDNVINNARNSGDNAADDLLGADGSKLLNVSFAGNTKSFLDSGDVFQFDGDDYIQFDSDNGSLFIRDDGQYWYENTTVNGQAEVIDTFEYKLVDGDGDFSSANLTITQVLGDSSDNSGEGFV